MRKNPALHTNIAPSSLNATFQDDTSTGYSTDGTNSDDGGGGKEEKNEKHISYGRRRRERQGSLDKKTFSPVVFVLLFGVLLSFLDVLYIMKHLESSPSEVISTVTLEEIQSRSGGGDNRHDKTNNGKTSRENTVDRNNPLAGREKIIKIITDAGISFDPVEDADLINELPLWSEVTGMYGENPILHGLNEGNCKRFQAHSEQGEHLLGTAGAFNSGTNLLSELLIANCIMPERMKKYGQKSRGIRWQVSIG